MAMEGKEGEGMVMEGKEGEGMDGGGLGGRGLSCLTCVRAARQDLICCWSD